MVYPQNRPIIWDMWGSKTQDSTGQQYEELGCFSVFRGTAVHPVAVSGTADQPYFADCCGPRSQLSLAQKDIQANDRLSKCIPEKNSVNLKQKKL